VKIELDLLGLLFIVAVVMLWRSIRKVQLDTGDGLKAISSKIDSLTIGKSRFEKTQATDITVSDSPQVDSHLAISYGNPGANIEVSLSALPPSECLRKINMPDASARSFSDFVLETAKLYGQGSGVQTFAVRFSPEVTRQLKNGQLELMQTTFAQKACAIDPRNGHRVKEIGSVVLAANPVAAVAFVWQVLAFITAQQFLADISKKLALIQSGVNEIRQFLVDHEQSQLLANHEYLQQVTDSVLKGNLGPEDVQIIGNQLESIERESCTAMHVGLKAGRRKLNQLKQKHDKVMFGKGFGKHIDYEKAETQSFSEWSRMVLVALAVRTAATYLRAALPLNKAIAHGRLVRIESDLATYNGVRAKFTEQILELNQTMSAKALSWHEPSAFIDLGKQAIEAPLKELQAHSNEMAEGIESVRKALDDSVGGHEIYAHVEGQSVTLFSVTP
jgi:hypothetical protein